MRVLLDLCATVSETTVPVPSRVNAIAIAETFLITFFICFYILYIIFKANILALYVI